MAVRYSSKSLHDYTKAFAKIFYKDITALKDKGEDIKRCPVLIRNEEIVKQVMDVTHKFTF